MSKHYNILYFFGNGFDLSLNLKTRYEDFYEYLKDNMPDNEYIKLMLQEIGKDKELWSDMELALGKFTEKFKSIDDYLSLCNGMDSKFIAVDKRLRIGIQKQNMIRVLLPSELLHCLKGYHLTQPYSLWSVPEYLLHRR